MDPSSLLASREWFCWAPHSAGSPGVAGAWSLLEGQGTQVKLGYCVGSIGPAGLSWFVKPVRVWRLSTLWWLPHSAVSPLIPKVLSFSGTRAITYRLCRTPKSKRPNKEVSQWKELVTPRLWRSHPVSDQPLVHLLTTSALGHQGRQDLPVVMEQ